MTCGWMSMIDAMVAAIRIYNVASPPALSAPHCFCKPAMRPRTARRSCVMLTSLLRNARLLDHVRPFGDVDLDPDAELLRGRAARLHAELRHGGADVRLRDRVGHLAREPLDDLVRRALRRRE